MSKNYQVPLSPRRTETSRYGGNIFSGRAGGSSSRLQNQPVTKEVIDTLKRQKMELIEERKLLKTKIARMEVQNKRVQKPQRPVKKEFLDHLEKEFQTLEQLIANQHRQIRELKESDDAALCQELQIDTKILYQERLRLQDFQIEQYSALQDSRQELDELLATDGPEVLRKQNHKIIQLKEKLHKYKHANKKLKAKINTLQQAKSSNTDNDEEIERRKQQLLKQIQEVKDATDENYKKLDKSRQDHEEMMKMIREKLQSQQP